MKLSQLISLVDERIKSIEVSINNLEHKESLGYVHHVTDRGLLALMKNTLRLNVKLKEYLCRNLR